jgi:hypothetical protein
MEFKVGEAWEFICIIIMVRGSKYIFPNASSHLVFLYVNICRTKLLRSLPYLVVI